MNVAFLTIVCLVTTPHAPKQKLTFYLDPSQASELSFEWKTDPKAFAKEACKHIADLIDADQLDVVK